MEMKKITLKLILLVSLFFSIALPVSAATYTYDELGRVLSVEYGDELSIEYTYDAAGNVLSITKVGHDGEETPDLPENPGEPETPGQPDKPVTSPEEPGQPEPPGEPEPELGESESDVPEGTEDELEEIASGGESGGEKVADTATSTYTMMAIGLILFVTGIGIYIIKKRRQKIA